uniref:Serpentine receptor class gamma n=1 Tax=Heterorhabditis bacteriophora TaxID=37862 RepID=A0A1I7W6H2_HETBA
MESTTTFEEHNDFLLLSYKINAPVSFVINLLAIYLIVFKSSREMDEYRWHLFNYQVWATSIDIFYNFLFQPVLFFPLFAGTGHGILITYFGFSTFTCVVSFWETLNGMWELLLFYNKFQCILANLICGLAVSIVELFFYRYHCIVKKLTKKQFFFYIIFHFFILSSLINAFLIVSHVDSSHWSEILKKWNPTLMDLLKIPNIYYVPYNKTAMNLFLYFMIFLILSDNNPILVYGYTSYIHMHSFLRSSSGSSVPQQHNNDNVIELWDSFNSVSNLFQRSLSEIPP